MGAVHLWVSPGHGRSPRHAHRAVGADLRSTTGCSWGLNGRVVAVTIHVVQRRPRCEKPCAGRVRPPEGRAGGGSTASRACEGTPGGVTAPARGRPPKSLPRSESARPAVNRAHVRDGRLPLVERVRLVLAEAEVGRLEGVRRGRRRRRGGGGAVRPSRGGEQRGQVDEGSPIRYRPMRKPGVP